MLWNVYSLVSCVFGILFTGILFTGILFTGMQLIGFRLLTSCFSAQSDLP